MFDRILVISVFFVASCGLAYELIAGALSSYLLGDSVLQFSTVIGCYLFAMGVGAHLSRYVHDRDVLARFVDVELAIGLIGGVSAALLFLAFAWLAAPFRALLYVIVFLIGALVGYVAYIWLLHHVSVTAASTYAFVNPVVAVALGAIVLGEAVTPLTLVAAALIVGAVVLLLVGQSRKSQPAIALEVPVREVA